MYIGLDLGTSGLKAVLIDDDQRIVADAHAPLNVARPQTGWSEQDPVDWIDALQSVMAALAVQSSLSAVRGIGLSGQMHGATLINADGDVLAPCMLWNDTRATTQAAAMDADPAFRDITGNIVFAGFTAPKVGWVSTHRPDLFSKISKVLLPKDYLRFWLTGDAVSDMSDAAGTSWLDTRQRDWSDDLLAKTKLTRRQMPDLVEGSAVSGTLRNTLAAMWGLPKGVVIAGGGGDNAASAVGVGVVKSGDAFVSLGTSGVLFAASDAYQPDAASAVHTFCHALPDTWHQMGVILAAADALNWYAARVGQDAATLTESLGALQAPQRALFLPYLGGERTPHNDANIRGAFVHLDHRDDTPAMTRAVLEGVTHAFVDSFQALESTGTQITRLIGIGGGARSEYWVRAIATALDMPIDIPVAGDFGGAFGAARLGLMAANGVGADIATRPEIARTIDPDTSLTAAFADAHARYRAAYHALKHLT